MHKLITTARYNRASSKVFFMPSSNVGSCLGRRYTSDSTPPKTPKLIPSNPLRSTPTEIDRFRQVEALAQQMPIGIRLEKSPPSPSAVLWSGLATQPVIANPYTGLIQVSDYEKGVIADELSQLLSKGILDWRGLSPHLICDGCDNGTFIPKIYRSISLYCNHAGASASILNGDEKKIRTAAQVAMTCISPRHVQGFIQDSFLVDAPSPPKPHQDVIQVRLPFRLLTIGSDPMNRRYLQRSLESMGQQDVILVSCLHKTGNNIPTKIPGRYQQRTSLTNMVEYTHDFNPNERQKTIDQLKNFGYNEDEIKKLEFKRYLTAYTQAGLNRLASECGGKVLWSQPVSTQNDYRSLYEALCAIIVRKPFI